ncbi:MAG TPA: LytR C-terminal domain-containing protein [Gaiellaceae bacterium]
MDHSFPAPDAVRPWRTATLVATGFAAVELVILLAIAVVALGRPLVHHHATAARTAASSAPAQTIVAPAPTKPRLARADLEVEILNGNGRQGAAASEASTVRGLGYVVGNVGNAARADYTRSVVMYRRGYRAEGLRLGRDLGIKAIGPLDGLHPSDLMGAHLAVVIGS